jgi:hypothetical protein
MPRAMDNRPRRATATHAAPHTSMVMVSFTSISCFRKRAIWSCSPRGFCTGWMSRVLVAPNGLRGRSMLAGVWMRGHVQQCEPNTIDSQPALCPLKVYDLQWSRSDSVPSFIYLQKQPS